MNKHEKQDLNNNNTYNSKTLKLKLAIFFYNKAIHTSTLDFHSLSFSLMLMVLPI